MARGLPEKTVSQMRESAWVEAMKRTWRMSVGEAGSVMGGVDVELAEFEGCWGLDGGR